MALRNESGSPARYFSKADGARFPAVLLLLAGLAWLGGGVTGCKTVDLGTSPGDSATDSVATATLRISNGIDIDPGTLTFYLFPGDTPDFANAANARKVGSVGYGKTVVFKVTAGEWKVAYENETGVLSPLRDEDSDRWLKGIFEKDGDYNLILATDGPDIVWVHTYAVE